MLGLSSLPRRAVRRACVVVAVAGLVAGAVPAARADSTESAAILPKLAIQVLSNRADLIAGGDALVAVDLSHGPSAKDVKVSLNGRNITRRFAVRQNGRFEGLVLGLKNGANNLVVSSPSRPNSQLTITNHPIGGPLFSGPQIQPWVCQAGAVDAKCNAPTTFAYQYRDAAGIGFHAYDPKNPPPDGTVATTTTDQGKTVPYIIRLETGYLDRDQYQIAVLFDPARPWNAWSPQPQWNHKLVITHGASCGIDHGAGTAPSVTDDAALSRGFAVMSTAADNAGHNCNLLTEAESLIMTKEHLVESYGELRYTIGTGCSGGSLVQQVVANAYPGVYQGILPQCSFPDSWTNSQQVEDYLLLRKYLEDPSKWAPGVVWTPASIGAVEGHPNHANSVEFSTLYGPLGDPTAPCAGVTAEQQYDPETNRKGVRCTLQDYMINLFGPRPQDGFAGVPYGNEGAQYGLLPLMAGQITPAQFVDVNAKVGAADIDANPTATRFRGDEFAVANAYKSGAFNETNNMGDVAIIDLRGPDPGAFHDVYRSYVIRARLDRELGTHANHVIWSGSVPLDGDVNYTTLGLIAMDRWLAAVEADHSSLPVSKKIIKDKPADIHDQCADGVTGTPVPQTYCDNLVVSYSTPRVVAGEPLTTDTAICVLKPLARADYYPVMFTDDQWAALRQTFPTGVCDYTKPGVGSHKTNAWQTYMDGPGKGRPLPPSPSGGLAWTTIR